MGLCQRTRILSEIRCERMKWSNDSSYLPIQQATRSEAMTEINRNEEVLRLLKGAEGRISGEGIAGELGISRAAVWKHVSRLREEGFSIDARPRLGYRLIVRPDKLIPTEIQDGLNTSFVGKEIFYYPKTESTNLVAKKLATDGAKEGTIVIAEEQTKGRGRLDRDWLSPGGKNILMSLIFRPKVSAMEVFSMTMLTSLAIVKAIKKTTTLSTQIKWPNDLYIGEKKIGGILTEFNAEQGRVNFVVIGVGLNVNFDPSVYPEIKDPSTSLRDVLGKDVPRSELLRSILKEIEDGYKSFGEGRASQLREEWNTYSLITGKPVIITSLDAVEEGIAEAVDADGCLILRDSKGRRKRIFCGDVSLRVSE